MLIIFLSSHSSQLKILGVTFEFKWINGYKIKSFICFCLHYFSRHCFSYWFFVFLTFQVKFWSQHISFILVGIIIVTSIRGLLITLTKVKLSLHKVFLGSSSLSSWSVQWNIFCCLFLVFLRNIKQQVFQCHCACPRSDHGECVCLTPMFLRKPAAYKWPWIWIFVVIVAMKLRRNSLCAKKKKIHTVPQ